MTKKHTYTYWFVRDSEEVNGLMELPECSLEGAVEEVKRYFATDVMYCDESQIHHYSLLSCYQGTEAIAFDCPITVEALGDRTVIAHFINLKEED